ncbi:CDP-alcohol phosphatidyltransferase family protein [Actinomadura opuntiae]|uniref:CDP-alcohol phosphatidyltransferase family protein n=1 Tax=Actinomadura sp. OS1-43 TaxID=604315 RepID=UPI00255B3C3F|nr:CDP-alcohol phosphatidyltransferase family protein [Actinomadura sp. OS1-43]MDL4816144.1 CDP-alcohol phosphatidyltransferase family protein [Actinomadura sp. OS1-43]
MTVSRPVFRPVRRGPVVWRAWELAGAACVQAAAVAALRPGAVGLAVGLGYALASWGVLGLAFRGRRALGPADHVTLARVVLVGCVAALVAGHLVHGGPVAVLVALASAALVLDGADGWVARRTGTASDLGARFDMEADALLILVLSVQVATVAGLWVLAIGTMRYAFVAASWAAPWLRSPLPPSFARKAVAVVQGVVLAAAASGAVPHAWAAVAAALALLAWSFGRDVLWLAVRHHGVRRGRGAHGTRRARVLDPVAR